MNLKSMRLAALGMALVIVSAMAFSANWRVANAQETGFNWTGYYWNNQNFTGNPALTRTDATINFNWGDGSPDPSIPSDHFSVRWQNTLNFGSGGTYTFRAGAKDGIRVAIDTTLIINHWQDVSSFTQTTAQISMGGGNHIITVDYYNDTGPAGVQFDWTTNSGSVAVEANGATAPTAGPSAVPGPTVAPALPHVRAQVRVALANIRSAPNGDSPLLFQVKFGTQLIVTASNGLNTWYYVTAPNGRQGWTFRHNMVLYGGNPALLAVSQQAVSPAPGITDVRGTARVPLLVRDYPSKRTGGKIGVINQFETFKILKLSRNSAWIFVDDNGLQGWVFLPNVQVVLGSVGTLPVANV